MSETPAVLVTVGTEEAGAVMKKKNKKKNKKKKKKQNKKQGDAGHEVVSAQEDFPLPLDGLPSDQAAEVRKAFLKERMRTALQTRRGMRERGDTEERTRQAIASAPPDQLQAAAKFFHGQPECLKKLHELAAQAGLPATIFDEPTAESTSTEAPPGEGSTRTSADASPSSSTKGSTQPSLPDSSGPREDEC